MYRALPEVGWPCTCTCQPRHRQACRKQKVAQAFLSVGCFLTRSATNKARVSTQVPHRNRAKASNRVISRIPLIAAQIGRASCRERAESAGVARAVKRRKHE